MAFIVGFGLTRNQLHDMQYYVSQWPYCLKQNLTDFCDENRWKPFLIGYIEPLYGISGDEIVDAKIAIDETTILEIKATILPKRYFQKSSFNIKILFGKSFCDN